MILDCKGMKIKKNKITRTKTKIVHFTWIENIFNISKFVYATVQILQAQKNQTIRT